MTQLSIPSSRALLASALTVSLLCASVALAKASPPDRYGWSGVDSLLPGPSFRPRYVTPPRFTGTEGAGSLSYPTLPSSGTTPYEAWTLVATDATTFTVTGGTSGAQASSATVGSTFTTSTGISFVINGGGSAFVAGDRFSFVVVPAIEVSELPAADRLSLQLGDDTQLSLARGEPNSPWNFAIRSPGENNYGQSNNHQLVIRDNGYLTFLNDSGPGAYQDTMANNEPLPSWKIFSSYRGTPWDVLPFWDALQPKATSRVWIGRLGVAPNRMLVVQWKDFGLTTDPSATLNFEAVFHESQWRVDFNYLQLSGAGSDGSAATVGYQGSLDNRYSAQSYGFNTAGLLATGVSVTFGRDQDGDWLPDHVESFFGTSSGTPFTDSGSPALSDAAQLAAGLDPLDPADNATAMDSDTDGLFNPEETLRGTNPSQADTDGDGVNDGIEVTRGTNPLKTDSDGDGLTDGEEDLDGDGTDNDSMETNPLDWDTDGDGVNDGLEKRLGTVGVDEESSGFAYRSSDGSVNGNVASALDSHGNLHVTGFYRSDNIGNRAHPLAVMLVSQDGGTLDVPVATSYLSRPGREDRSPAVVVVPGEGTRADRTIIIDGDDIGRPMLTELDFNRAPLDGGTVTVSQVVVRERSLNLPLGIQHPHAALASDGNIHLSFLGWQYQADTSNFTNQKADRGVYHVKVSPQGEVLSGPTELFYKRFPVHPHTHPRIAVDRDGNVHGVFRAGTCAWNPGPTLCSMYYFKMGPDGAVRIPTTRLALEGMGGIDKGPDIAVSPNGNVNIVYASIAPKVSPIGRTCGGYCAGRPIVLHVLSTTDDKVTTLVNQKQLVGAEPPPGTSGDTRIAVWHKPSVATDSGGNLHVFASDDNSSGHGYYFVFNPAGERAFGPLHINRRVDTRVLREIEVRGTRTYLSWLGSGRLSAASFDFGGLGLDLSGGGQLPPAAEGPAPTLTAVTPASALPGTVAEVTVTGTGFLSGAKLSIGGVALEQVVIWGETQASGVLRPGHGLAEGNYDVVLTNTTGKTATLGQGFRIGYAAPRPTAVVPGNVQAGEETVLAIVGSGFREGATVRFGDTEAKDVRFLSEGGISATVPNELSGGAHDVVVTNTDGQSGTLAGGLNAEGGGCGCVTVRGSEGSLALFALFGLVLFSRRRALGLTLR